MTELEARISDARVRLTAMQQDARQGHRGRVLIGLLALASELTTFVYDQTAEQLRRSH